MRIQFTTLKKQDNFECDSEGLRYLMAALAEFQNYRKFPIPAALVFNAI